jgi:hypothetical protein
MLKLELNKPLKDDQFELQQPPGAEVVRLGQKPSIEPISQFQTSGSDHQ